LSNHAATAGWNSVEAMRSVQIWASGKGNQPIPTVGELQAMPALVISSQRMKSELLLAHLSALVLAAIALWSMRYEITERAATRLDWTWAPVCAVAAGTVLLIVSPGKRFELWVAAIVIGLALGAGAAVLLKVNQDFGRRVIRVARAWDGVGAAALLLLLAVARLVSSNLMDRPSGKFGVLGAGAAFLAAYLVARFIVVHFVKAPKAIHLDMARGENPRRTLAH
jgi:hypothetical protein